MRLTCLPGTKNLLTKGHVMFGLFAGIRSTEISTRVILLAFLIAITACSKPGQFEIKGTITNSLAHKVYLDRLDVNGTVAIDSSKISKDGNFKIRGTINQPTFFLLRLGSQNFITLLLDSNEQVSFSSDFINFSSDYKIAGSAGSIKVQELNRKLLRTNTSVDSLQSLIKLNSDDAQSQLKKQGWLAQITRLCEDQQRFSNKFILDNPFSLASVLCIYQKFNNGEYVVQDLQTIKIAASALYSMYPNSEHAKTLYDDTRSMMKNVQNMKLQEFINSKGMNSPDISLPNPSGTNVSLSSLGGKYVLLHFWSAYDANSRILNPVLKENYAKFHPKGFEIYQVSVDTSRQGWLKAIADDGMNWINVGDMKGSREALVSYNIHSVPMNYLLDREGKIIARDLKGPALYAKLSEILN